MLAQRTLEKWSSDGRRDARREPRDRAAGQPTTPAPALDSSRRSAWCAPRSPPDCSSRSQATTARARTRGSPRSPPSVSAAASRASVEALEDLVSGDGRLAEVARLALIDLDAVPDARIARADGLTIGQLFLHADIDPSLAAVGAGDNGGIATLLVRLGDALVADPSTGVERVITLSRGPVAQAAEDLLEIGSATSGHVYGRVPLLPAAGAVGRGLAACG